MGGKPSKGTPADKRLTGDIPIRKSPMVKPTKVPKPNKKGM